METALMVDPTTELASVRASIVDYGGSTLRQKLHVLSWLYFVIDYLRKCTLYGVLNSMSSKLLLYWVHSILLR